MVRNVYVDSLVHDEPSLKFLISKIGIDNILLGSDAPFVLGEHHPGLMIEKSSLSEEDKNKILYKNAQKFFNM